MLDKFVSSLLQRQLRPLLTLPAPRDPRRCHQVIVSVIDSQKSWRNR